MQQIVFITGATAGIGEATAIKFAKNGWNLVLTGRRGERLKALASRLSSEFGVRAQTLEFDIRHRSAVEQAWESLPLEWRQIDLLINNAGLALDKSPIQDNDPDDWDVMIDTNVKGLLYMSRMIMPGMIERKQGHIINIGSIAGREVYAGGSIYCASKFAVEAISRSMRIDLLPHKIRVTSISPGLVETEFSVVRFKGDEAKADAVYQDYEPLVAKDIAESIYWAASQPPHVCINDILLTCTAQADSRTLYKG